MIDYHAFLERARSVNASRQPKAPDRIPEPPPIKPAVPFKWHASGLALQGFANLYNVKHEFRGGTDIFERNCFEGSLDSVFFGIDHRYERPALGTQDEGTLELADTSVGLAFRLALQPGHLEKLAGRDQVSVACVPSLTETRNGVRHIKRATLVEISAVYVGAMTTTHAVIVKANKVGPLIEDAKHGFACESAATAFVRALKRLQ